MRRNAVRSEGGRGVRARARGGSALSWDAIAAVVAAVFGAAWAGAAIFVWPAHRWAALSQLARGFGAAIDLRAPRYAGETERAAELVRISARRTWLGRIALERARFAARLSNIGLAAVPFRVLNPASTEHDSAEDRRVRELIAGRHPEIGAAMVELIPVIGEVAPLIRGHHAPVSEEPFVPGIAVVAASSAFAAREREGGSAAARDLMVQRAAAGDGAAAVILRATDRV